MSISRPTLGYTQAFKCNSANGYDCCGGGGGDGSGSSNI